MSTEMRRAVIWAQGRFTRQGAKTAAGIVRLGRRFEVVAVIDSRCAGSDAGKELGDGPNGIPVIASLAEAMALRPDTFILGFAPFECTDTVDPGILAVVREALDRGLHVVSSLHCMLGDDPELSILAKRCRARIWDVRRSPAPRLWDGRILTLGAAIWLTCGNDCSVGKMTSAILLCREAERRGLNAGFVATGQTGILIGCDAGTVVDHIAGDFMSGAVEQAVCESACMGREVVVVEGNGALTHPAYGGVTAAIVQGCQPHHVVLCWEHGRRTRKHWDGLAVDPPDREWELIQAACVSTRRPQLAGLCVQTSGLDETRARLELAGLEDQWGVPATDAVRFGVEGIVDQIRDCTGR